MIGSTGSSTPPSTTPPSTASASIKEGGRGDRGARRYPWRSVALAIAYFGFSAVGVIGTWYFNLQFVPTAESPSYLEAWFANPASSSAAVDVIVVAVVACIFYVREAFRLGRLWILVAIVLIPLTFAVALAFTFPLFLALRELALGRNRSAARPT